MKFPCQIVASAGIAALTVLLAVPEAARAAEQKGKIAFNNTCRTCHSAVKGDNRLGPSLYGVVGRKAGTAPGYKNYSQAMATSGVVWDEATLDKFIANPESVVRNNNMKPYAGLPDPDTRKAIIEFLKSTGKSSS